MERIKQQLQVARKQREQLQQGQASAYADIAKEKLGLKDVWIMKR